MFFSKNSFSRNKKFEPLLNVCQVLHFELKSDELRSELKSSEQIALPKQQNQKNQGKVPAHTLKAISNFSQ